MMLQFILYFMGSSLIVPTNSLINVLKLLCIEWNRNYYRFQKEIPWIISGGKKEVGDWSIGVCVIATRQKFFYKYVQRNKNQNSSTTDERAY